MELSAAIDAPLTADRPRVDRERGVLTGSRCGTCGAESWPARAVCYRCGSGRMDEVDLPATGTLLTHTTVWVPRPGLTPPYTLGLIRLAGPSVTLFAHVRKLPPDAAAPLPVTLRISPQEGTVPPFWFEPSPSHSAGEDGV